MRAAAVLWIIPVVMLSVVISACATPQEYGKFRYVGEKTGSEDTFVVDRERCRWKSPPIPIVAKYVYRSCMIEHGWFANE